MKSVEKYIIGIFGFFAIGAIGIAVYFGINAEKDNLAIEENKQQESVGEDKEENDKNNSLENVDEREIEKQIYKIYESVNLYTWKLAYDENDQMLNIYKGSVTDFDDNYKYLLALGNATVSPITQSDKEYIKWSNENDIELSFNETGKITGEQVRNNLYTYFGDYNYIKNFYDVNEACTYYHYDSENDIFYVDVQGCGYIGPYKVVTDYEIQKKDNNYYIYQYVAYLNYVDDEKGLYGVYKEYNDFLANNDNYIETANDYKYKINTNNRTEFHKYAYKFVEGENGNWYLDSIEMVK